MGHELLAGKAGKPKEVDPPARPAAWRIPLLLRLGLGLPLVGAGLFVVSLPWARPGVPIWIFPHGLTVLGLGLMALALDAPAEGADRIPDGPLASRRLLRLGLLLAGINTPLAFYLTMGAEMRTVGPETFVWIVALINLASAWATGILAPARSGPRTIGFSATRLDDDRLLALHDATLSRAVSCPFCRGPVAPGESAACTHCETLHHIECWQENGRCTTYACGGTAAADLAGSRVG